MTDQPQQGHQYEHSADVLADIRDTDIPVAQQINEIETLSEEDMGNPLLQEAAKMLAFRHYKHDIKHKLEEMIQGPIDAYLFEVIHKKAHILMRQVNMMTPDDNLDQSIAFWSRMVADPRTSEAGKHKCQERLDKLLGTESRADTGVSVQDKAEQAIKLLQSITEDVLSNGL